MKKVSKNKIKININYLYLLYFIPFIIFIYRYIVLGVDIWYMLSEGKYILNNGFPHIDPFTIHEGFKIVIQQWLSDIIFYIIYKFTGDVGLIVFSCIMFMVLEFLLYKLCKLVSDNNKLISLLVSSIISILLEYNFFIDIRPHLFTYLFLIIWVYILEKYNKTNNKKLLFILPIISILQINMHAAMWWFIFVFSLPFIVEYLYLIFIKKKYKELRKFYTLVLFIIVSLFCGLINPYGIDSINYLFNGTNDYINKFIVEMVPPKILSVQGLLLIIILFINYIISLKYYSKTKELKISYLFLLFGSLILAFHSMKSYLFFLIFGVYYWAYYFRKEKSKYFVEEKSLKVNIIVIVIPILYLLISYATGHVTYAYSAGLLNSSNYYDYLIEYKKDKDIKVYNTYEIGSYMEFLNLKPYIDTRAEFFLKSQNKKKNVFIEYYDLQNNILDLQVFLDTYNFTHLLVYEKDYLFGLDDIEGYTLIMYENDYMKLYIRNDLLENNE